MGTFGYFTEKRDGIIPEDKKEEFSRNMCKLINRGGMMKLDKVCMYGQELIILVPIEFMADEEINFHYNYFEDCSWESAGYDPKTCSLWSGKIGSSEFNDVIMAGYMMYEAYTDKGFAVCNGEVLNHTEYMGWINHVLGTTFSMKDRFDLWRRVEEYAEWRGEDYEEDRFTTKSLLEIIPHDMLRLAGGIDLADIMYVLNGTGDLTLENPEIHDDSYPSDVMKCKQLLDKYFTEKGHDGIDGLWRLLKKDYNLRVEEKDPLLKDIAEATLYMPARVFVYLTVECFDDMGFWSEWFKIKDSTYEDEKWKEYASEELNTLRKKGQDSPIDPVPTSDFLCQDGFFTFFDTPEELAGKPNYYISDDDRLFWWDGSDEVDISDGADKWLKDMASRHSELLEAENLMDVGDDFLKFFLNILVDADNYYGRVMPFQSMFYEFLQNSKDPNFIAAVKLYKCLADDEENKKMGGVIKYAQNRAWDMVSKNVTCNKARMELKRYLSVMANSKLRKKYFKF